MSEMATDLLKSEEQKKDVKASESGTLDLLGMA